MKFNFNSAEEYAEAIITMIQDGENESDESERINESILKYWFEGIREKTKETWIKNLTGSRDSYILSDVEVEELYRNATDRYFSDVLDGMHEKGLLELSIGEGGEFYYGLSEEGKKIAEQFKQPDNE